MALARIPFGIPCLLVISFSRHFDDPTVSFGLNLSTTTARAARAVGAKTGLSIGGSQRIIHVAGDARRCDYYFTTCGRPTLSAGFNGARIGAAVVGLGQDGQRID